MEGWKLPALGNFVTSGVVRNGGAFRLGDVQGAERRGDAAAAARDHAATAATAGQPLPSHPVAVPRRRGGSGGCGGGGGGGGLGAGGCSTEAVTAAAAGAAAAASAAEAAVTQKVEESEVAAAAEAADGSEAAADRFRPGFYEAARGRSEGGGSGKGAVVDSVGRRSGEEAVGTEAELRAAAAATAADSEGAAGRRGTSRVGWGRVVDGASLPRCGASLATNFGQTRQTQTSGTSTSGLGAAQVRRVNQSTGSYGIQRRGLSIIPT